MGLLDYQTTPPPMGTGLLAGGSPMDPRTLGLLQAGFAGLEASGPSRMPVSLGQVIGRAGNAGIHGMQQGAALNQSQQMHALQIQEMQRQQIMREQAARAQAQFAASLPESERVLFAADPAGYLKHRAENPYGKVDPQHYTPESIADFNRTRDYSKLVPLRKKEPIEAAGPTGAPETRFIDPYAPPAAPIAKPVRNEMVNLGGTTQPVNPYTQNGFLTRTASPDALLANDRQKEANTIANSNKNIQLTEGIRKEFNALPEVKNYKEVLPIIESVKRAPNTPAGDIDLIYGVGKIMDPNSVVREGELNLVIKSGSPAQRLQGYVSYVKGGGRLTKEQREQLTAVMDSRVNALKNNYEAARNSYTGIVTQQGLKPSEVFPDLATSPIDNADIEKLVKMYLPKGR